MERERITEIVFNAPAWIRASLGGADIRLRERAADALAATIASKLQEPHPELDLDQLALPL